MDTKVTLAYGVFNLTLEGSEAFVEAQLNKWAEKIPSVTLARASGAGASDAPDRTDSSAVNGPQGQAPANGDEVAKKPRKMAAKTGGPSCASRIRTLAEEGFFATPKKAADIGEKLKEKATPYEGKHIAAALISIVQKGQLRRVSDGGVWTYVNP